MITLEEMTSYLTSVFKIMHEKNSEFFDELGVSSEELASVTAEQAFEGAGALLDAYGNMSFKAFKNWYLGTPKVRTPRESARQQRSAGSLSLRKLAVSRDSTKCPSTS